MKNKNDETLCLCRFYLDDECSIFLSPLNPSTLRNESTYHNNNCAAAANCIFNTCPIYIHSSYLFSIYVLGYFFKVHMCILI